MPYVVSGIGKKGRRLYAKTHPASAKERVKFTRKRAEAYEFPSRHSAGNIRDDMLETFKHTTVSYA